MSKHIDKTAQNESQKPPYQSSNCKYLKAGWCKERIKNCEAALLQDDGSVACEMAL